MKIKPEPKPQSSQAKAPKTSNRLTNKKYLPLLETLRQESKPFKNLALKSGQFKKRHVYFYDRQEIGDTWLNWFNQKNPFKTAKKTSSRQLEGRVTRG